MATLIPSMGTCAFRMTRSERRMAQRLKQKCDKGIPKSVINPLAFPWSYGVVFSNFTRKQFEATELQSRL